MGIGAAAEAAAKGSPVEVGDTSVANAFALNGTPSTPSGLVAKHEPYRNYADAVLTTGFQNLRPINGGGRGWEPLVRTTQEPEHIRSIDLKELAAHVKKSFPDFRFPSFTYLSGTKADLAAKHLIVNAIKLANKYLPLTDQLRTRGEKDELIGSYLVAEEFFRFLFFAVAARTRDEIETVLLRAPEEHRAFVRSVLAGEFTRNGTMAPRRMSSGYLQKLEELGETPWLNSFVAGTLFIDITAFNKIFPYHSQFVKANGGDLSKEAQIALNLRRIGNRWLDMMLSLKSADVPAHMAYPVWVSDRLRQEPVAPNQAVEDVVSAELLTVIPHSAEAKDVVASAIGKFLFLAVKKFEGASEPLSEIDLSLDELYITRKLFRSKFREVLAILKQSGMIIVDEPLFERCMKHELAKYMRSHQDIFPRTRTVISELLDFFTKGRQET